MRDLASSFQVLHKSPIDFLILESSPVSTADSIEVQTNFDPKPTAENRENKQGVVAWERSIEPGADLKVSRQPPSQSHQDAGETESSPVGFLELSDL